jgi:uncharacterized protein YodC (DUF2158 family)
LVDRGEQLFPTLRAYHLRRELAGGFKAEASLLGLAHAPEEVSEGGEECRLLLGVGDGFEAFLSALLVPVDDPCSPERIRGNLEWARGFREGALSVFEVSGVRVESSGPAMRVAVVVQEADIGGSGFSFEEQGVNFGIEIWGLGTEGSDSQDERR